MKKLYICEAHHHVLLPWAWTRRLHKELNLLTLDHHTDTHDAFLVYLYYHKDETLDSLVAKTDFRDDTSIRYAMAKLKNDEHIDTAIKCGILRKAFVISHDGAFDHPTSNELTAIWKNPESFAQYAMHLISLPEIQTYPDVSLYTVGTNGHLDDENGVSDEFLSAMLAKIQTMNGINITQTEFILDIDLDYFHSYTSLKQHDLMVFRNLLSSAAAITIATEPEFAHEGIDPNIILNEIIALTKKETEGEVEVIDLR